MKIEKPEVKKKERGEATRQNIQDQFRRITRRRFKGRCNHEVVEISYGDICLY